jgi:4-hydroxy-tetrahydrodipicolinate synthase
MKFRGIVPPVVTWFSENDRLDLDAQFAHLDFLIQGGVNGVFLQGSTGEFAYLSLDERKEQARQVVSYVDGRIPVLVGVSANTTAEAAELAANAEKIGAGGIAATPLYYWVLSEDQIIAHYRAIGQSCSLPFLAYNFPALTGHDLTPDLVLRMLENIPTFCGIKDTVDSQKHLREMIRTVKEDRPDFVVFAGYDEYLLPTLATGGDGVIGATANFAPQIQVGLYRAFQENDFPTVIDSHRKISRLMEIYTLASPPISAIKAAVLSAGILKGSTRVRSPLPPSDAAGYVKIRDVLEASGVSLPT